MDRGWPSTDIMLRPFLSGGHFPTVCQLSSESLRIPRTFTLTQQEVATDTWMEAWTPREVEKPLSARWALMAPLRTEPHPLKPGQPWGIEQSGRVAESWFSTPTFSTRFQLSMAEMTLSTLAKSLGPNYISFIPIYLFFILVLKTYFFKMHVIKTTKSTKQMDIDK